MKMRAFRLATVAVLAFLMPWVTAPVSPAAAQQTCDLKANPTNVHWGRGSAVIKPVLSFFVQP